MSLQSCSNLKQKFLYNFETLSNGLYHKKIALAVSGGVDSVAMLHLIHEYAETLRINLIILTVNHNLRPEAADEVSYVSNLAEKLGHECIILNWDHQNNFSNLSARARNGRYNLMTEVCNKKDILTLVTAHHLDDNLETLLIKKERKSGRLALSSGNIYFHNNVRILRPLYSVNKLELIEYVRSLQVKWMEDSSNGNIKYLRNKVRKDLTHKDEIYKIELQSEQQLIDIEIMSLCQLLIEAIAETAKIYKYGFAIIDIEKFKTYSLEIRLRLVSYILNVISGSEKICRASSLLSIISTIEDSRTLNKTLHGCVIKNINDKLLIYRHFGKVTPNNELLRNETIWDRRFNFSIKADTKSTHITYLKLNDYKKIKENLNLDELKKLSFNHHHAIIFTLPVIKKLEKIVAIPHISYYEDCFWKKEIGFSYFPSFTSRFIHFC